MVFVDTSFLISLYGSDVNTAAARAHLEAFGAPIEIQPFNEFEFINALRLLVFRKKITIESRAAQVSAYETDKKAGKLRSHVLTASHTLAEADAISATHTETGGHRAYDILHVAAAKLLGATDFWSFDERQRDLARAEGMSVGP